METVTKGWWRRKRGYEKLNGSGRKRTNRVQMGSIRRRRFWRIKVAPKLSFLKRASPKRFFVWLRDEYVKMMMRLANSRVMSSGYGWAVEDGIGGFGRGPLKEYDEKMIVEMYKSIVMAQGHLMPRDAGKLGAENVCRVR